MEKEKSNRYIGTRGGSVTKQHIAIGGILIVPDKVFRTPEHAVQENHHGLNQEGKKKVEPGSGNEECDDGEKREWEDCEGEVIAGEVEEVPGGGEEEENEEREWVAEEGEEEDEEEDEGVVEEEVGDVVSEARGGFGDGGREGEGEEVKKYAPRAARGDNGLTCFLYIGEHFRRGQHCGVQKIDGIWNRSFRF